MSVAARVGVAVVIAGALGLGSLGCDQTGDASGVQAPAPRTVVLAIDGMHCEACTEAIEGKLLKIQGVETAEVSLADARVTILAAPSVDESVLESVIDKLGYDAHAPSAPATAEGKPPGGDEPGA